MTITDKVAAFQLSFVCALLDAIRRSLPPKSAKWNVINNLEDRVQRALDVFRAETWSVEDISKASALFATMDRKIDKLFPKTKALKEAA